MSVRGVNLSGGSPVCPCLFPGEVYLQHTRTTDDSGGSRTMGVGGKKAGNEARQP